MEALEILLEKSELVRQPAPFGGHRGLRRACEKAAADCSGFQMTAVVWGTHAVLTLLELELELALALKPEQEPMLRLELAIVAPLLLEEEDSNCWDWSESEDELMVVEQGGDQVRLHMPVAVDMMAGLSRTAHFVPVVQAAVARQRPDLVVTLLQKRTNSVLGFVPR